MRFVALRPTSRGFGVLQGDQVLSVDRIKALAHISGSPEQLVKRRVLREVQVVVENNIDLLEPIGELSGALVGSPVQEPAHMLFIGLNYADHAREIGVPAPTRPHVFSKLRGSLNGPYDPVPIPHGVKQLDHEVELGVVVGARLRNAPPSAVRESIAGYVVVNDFSARDWQFANDQQLTIGKGFSGLCTVGPSLVTPDEVPRIDASDITCAINGDVVQYSSTSELLFGIDEAISFLSRVVELQPGDLVSTGTPAGVQQGKRVPSWLRPGDVVESSIEGVGLLRNTITR